MKIKLVLRPCSPALAARLVADEALAKQLGARPNGPHWLFPKAIDADGPWLEPLLTHARGEEISFLRDVQFDAREIDAASRVEAMCRVTSGQTRAEAARTLAAYKATPLQPTHGRWSVRRPSGLYLSRAVPPDTLAHVDQWTGETVVGSEVAAALRRGLLGGWQLQPVLTLRGPAREDVFHLVSPHAAPEARVDETWAIDPDGTPRRVGSLAYAPGALDGLTDFARSAEPWGPWQTPVWIVSQAARRWVEDCGWRGWAFRPVLEVGSALHEQQRASWNRLRQRLAAQGPAAVHF